MRRSLIGKELAYPWVKGAQGGQWRTDMLDPSFGPDFLAKWGFPHMRGDVKHNFRMSASDMVGGELGYNQWNWACFRATHAQGLGSVPEDQRSHFLDQVKCMDRWFHFSNPEYYAWLVSSLSGLPQDRWERTKTIPAFVSCLNDHDQKYWALHSIPILGEIPGDVFRWALSIHQAMTHMYKGRYSISSDEFHDIIVPFSDVPEELWKQAWAAAEGLSGHVSPSLDRYVKAKADFLLLQIPNESKEGAYAQIQRLLQKSGVQFTSAAGLYEFLMMMGGFDSQEEAGSFVTQVLQSGNSIETQEGLLEAMGRNIEEDEGDMPPKAHAEMRVQRGDFLKQYHQAQAEAVRRLEESKKAEEVRQHMLMVRLALRKLGRGRPLGAKLAEVLTSQMESLRNYAEERKFASRCRSARA